MAVSLKHAFVSAIPDGADATLIRPSNWNAEHTLTAAANTLLGAVTAGTVTEITCTAAGRAILDDADAAAQRTTLGLGTIATQAASSVAITGGTISGTAITPRMSSTTATASLSWNSANFDIYALTAQTSTLTMPADSNTTPSDGQKITFRIKPATATTTTITWTTGATRAFRAVGVALPTSLAALKTTYIGAIYNSADSRWDVIAVSTEA